MNNTEQLGKDYYELLKKQTFIEKDLDYSALEKYRPMLKNLSLLENNGVYVFDLYRRENVFTTYNFTSLFGYDQAEEERKSSEFLNSRIHPEDFHRLIENAIHFVKFLLPLTKEERSQYKLVNEFRLKNKKEQYIYILEQYQILEFDKHGNAWLALGVMDISPEQDADRKIESQLLEYKSGRFLPLNSSTDNLSKEAFYSVENTSRLTESVKKVNVQRKKIIEKLHAENAADVSKRIIRYGLLE